MCDVRQPLAPGSLRALLHSLSDPSVGCVSGSLVLAGNTGAGAYWRYEQLIRRSEARIGSMVGVSGSIYARTASGHARASARCPARRHVRTAEDGALRRESGSSWRRQPRSTTTHATTSTSSRARSGRWPATTSSSQRCRACSCPWMNPMWFQMTSHKLLRLVCPWALIALFCSSEVLAFHSELSARRSLLLADALLRTGGVLRAGGLGSRAGRSGALARTFVVLNAAAVVGLVAVPSRHASRHVVAGGQLGRSLHGHGLREIARTVHVAAAKDGDVIREELERDGVEDGREARVHGREADHRARDRV